MTLFADPDRLRWVDVLDHRSALGARPADQVAAAPAVVSTMGHRELEGAAHARVGGVIRDPGDGKVGPEDVVAALQKFGLTVCHVLNPGLLLLLAGGCHEEGLAWCADQPLVPVPGFVQLDGL